MRTTKTLLWSRDRLQSRTHNSDRLPGGLGSCKIGTWASWGSWWWWWWWRWHWWLWWWWWWWCYGDDSHHDQYSDGLLGHDPSSTSNKVLPGMWHHAPRLKSRPRNRFWSCLVSLAFFYFLLVFFVHVSDIVRVDKTTPAWSFNQFWPWPKVEGMWLVRAECFVI